MKLRFFPWFIPLVLSSNWSSIASAQQTACRQVFQGTELQQSRSPSPAGKRRRGLEDRSYISRPRQGQENKSPNRKNTDSEYFFYDYITRMKKLYPPLPHSRQEALLTEFKKTGDIKIRNKIVLHNLGLVVKVVNKYRWALSPVVDMMDLIQVGNTKLIEAVEKYKPELGGRLSTYAFILIKEGIKNFVFAQAHIVRITHSSEHDRIFFSLHKQEMFSAEQAAENLSADKKTKVKPETVEWMRNHLSSDTVSFNKTPVEQRHLNGIMNSNLNLEEINSFEEIYDREALSLEDLIAAERELEKLTKMMRMFLSGLNEKEKDIFIKRILMYPPVSIDKLAETYNISRLRISRIRYNLLRKLQKFAFLNRGSFPGISSTPGIIFSDLFRSKFFKVLNSWTESAYGMSLPEYIQADQAEPHYLPGPSLSIK